MNYINTWNLDLFNEHLHKYYHGNLNALSYSIAGEGNMNFTYRLELENHPNVIIKQAPPFCAKFPSIPAPINRIEFEQSFYEIVNQSESLEKFSPQILGHDKSNNIIYMSDLGEGSDYEGVYAFDKIDEESLYILCRYLNELHTLDVKDIKFLNSDMKSLNYNYIFKLPFDKNDQAINLDDVTPGLAALGQDLKKQDLVIKKIHELGEIYLNDKRCLIHGDFYPRSWLKTTKGLFVIDPEFAFIGRAEFDIGVFLAHMAMSKDFKRTFSFVQEKYQVIEFSWDLALDFCATEVLRRIFYVSQLPIENNLEFKESLYLSSIKRLKDKSYRFEGVV